MAWNFKKKDNWTVRKIEPVRDPIVPAVMLKAPAAQFDNSHFYRNIELEIGCFNSYDVTVAHGVTKPRGRQLMTIIDYESNQLAVPKPSNSVVNKDDISSKQLMENFESNWNSVVAVASVSLMTPIIVAMIAGLSIAWGIGIGFSFFVLVCLAGGVYQIHTESKYEEKIRNEPQNFQNSPRSKPDGLTELEHIMDKEVTAVTVELGEALIKFLRNFEKRKNVSEYDIFTISKLIEDKIEVSDYCDEMVSWLMMVENILEADSDFPLDLIPVLNVDTEEVVVSLQESLIQSAETENKLTHHRKSVMKNYAKDDSKNTANLALNYIRLTNPSNEFSDQERS